MARKTKTVEIEGKKFKITEPDCILARRAYILMQTPENRVQNREEVLKILLSGVELEFPDGRSVVLDSDEIIKQHLNLQELLKLEDEAASLAFDFLINGGN